MSESNGFSPSSYKKNLLKTREELPSETVAVPSGFDWKLRRVGLETFMQSDELPAGLVSKSLAFARGDVTAQQFEKQLTPDELKASIVLKREIVKQATVLPRIVADVVNEDEEIAARDVSTEDYEFIYNWARGGGGEAETLENFRARRKPDVVGRKNGKKRRAKTK